MAIDAASIEIECVLQDAAQTGESPTWSEAEQALYWIDIQQPALHRYDPTGRHDRHWTLPDEIGCFALRADMTGAVVALRGGLHALRFADGALTLLAPPPYDPTLFRFNEGGCDETGRFWLGTMYDPKQPDDRPASQKPKGEWHCYSEAAGLQPRPDYAVIPNGLAWSEDFRTMFIAHYEQSAILAFDFDAATGHLGRERVFARIPQGIGKPDGGTIDAEGCYWSALHGGGRLRRLRPNGDLDFDVMLPVSQPTMCAFGDADLSTLYITSASVGLDPGERAQEPLAGKLLRCRPGVRGRPLPTFAHHH